MTIGIPAFDRLIKILLARIDRLEAKLNSGRRSIQPSPVVINGKEYFSVNDLTIIFQVTAHTIYKWRDDGTLPLVKVGGKYYIETSELQKAMSANGKTEPMR